MSDTPKTDAVHESNVKATDPNRLGVEDYLAMMHHARTLERQNAELLAALKRIAAYPMTRVSEITASGLRDIAREAIRRAEG